MRHPLIIAAATPGVIVAASVVAPVALAHGLSSLALEQGLDIFSVLALEMLGFALSVAILRPRPWVAVLTAFLYFPLVFIVIFWIGLLAGYYDLP